MSLIEKDSLYYYLIGVEDINKGDLESAIKHFDASLEIEEHFKTYQKKADVLEMKGLYKESCDTLRKAYALNPNNDNIAVSLARKLYKVNEIYRVKDILNSVLQRNPTYNSAKKLLEEINLQNKI